MNTTYITFGTTNPYQAQRNGLFRGRTRIAIRYDYCTKKEASESLMVDCVLKNDNYTIADDCSAVLYCDGAAEIIMKHGDLRYHHDGYTYESIELNDLTEDDAKIGIRDGAIWGRDLDLVYEMYPDLAPAVEADEE